VILKEATSKFQLKKRDLSELTLFILDEKDHPVPLGQAIGSGMLANGMTVCVGKPHADQPLVSQPSASLPTTEQDVDEEEYYDAEGDKLLAGCTEHHPLDVIWQHPTTNALLYCGNIRAARNLKTLQEHGITRIVNCTANLDNYFEAKAQGSTVDVAQASSADESSNEQPAVERPVSEGAISYFRLNMSAHSRNVHTDEDAVKFVMPMLDFVQSALHTGSNALVHCKAGAHRAGTAAIICLMYLDGLTKLEAAAEARRRRVAIDKGWGGIGSLPLLMNRLDREWERERRVKASASYDIDFISDDVDS